MDYPFQIASAQPPPPLTKNRRRGVCGGGSDWHRLVSNGQSLSISSLKTANSKLKFLCPVFSMIMKDCTEGCLPLPCPWASLFPAVNAFRVTWSERVYFSNTPPKCLHRNYMGRRLKGTRHGNAHLIGRENQGIVTGNCCLSAPCFANSDISSCCFPSISRARPPKNRKVLSPARSQIFSMEKISSSRERRKWSLGLGHN